jgi:hypothetical protein
MATSMNAIEHALLAVVAANDGDEIVARAHICRAQQHARANARRERQIVEIAALVVANNDQRAAGLGLEHAVEFPEDADLLTRMTEATRYGIDGPPSHRTRRAMPG